MGSEQERVSLVTDSDLGTRISVELTSGFKFTLPADTPKTLPTNGKNVTYLGNYIADWDEALTGQGQMVKDLTLVSLRFVSI